MQPLPMNEFIQQNLAEVGIKVDFEVVEWNALINIWRAGAKYDLAQGRHGMNYTYFIQDPFTGFIRHLNSISCRRAAPTGASTATRMDALFDEVRNTFDQGAGRVLQRDPREDTSTRRCSCW